MENNDGEKILETIASVNRQLQDGKFAEPWEGVEVMSKLLKRYNDYLKLYNKERKYN